MSRKILLSVSLLFAVHFQLSAQKSLNKQNTSLRIPANFKIDGKADEWNNMFQAYNKATQLNYTVANSDSALYFIFNSNDADIVRKILAFGITVSINNAAENSLSVTFPLEHYTRRVYPVPTDKKSDSLSAEVNRKFAANAKTLKISGIDGVSDSEISIYNAFDIRVASSFDKTLAYTYELFIPLKYLNVSAQEQSKLNYKVQINKASPNPNITVSQTDDGKATIIKRAGSNGEIIVLNTPEMLTAINVIDFSGEYLLSKE